MKKIIAVIMCLVFVVSLSACKTNAPTTEGERVSVSAEKAEEMFEDMTEFAQQGKYDKAVEYYNSGAADAADTDVRNWYYYSLAMQEHEEHGCVGYPLTLLQYNADEDFEPAKKAIGELQLIARDLNGAYDCDGVYVYILDGKIATSVGVRLTGMVFSSYEVVVNDETFFFAERETDGTHTLLYSIDYSNGQLTLNPTEDNTDDLFSGSYKPFSAEYPEIIY